MRKPFYWAVRKAWYVKSPGGRRNIRLHENEKIAHEMWAEQVAADNLEASQAVTAAILEAYLEFSQSRLSQAEYKRQSYYLALFANEYGMDRARTLKAHSLTKWIDSHKTWGSSSHRGAIGTIKRVFNWAMTEGLITRNPFAGVQKPGITRREVLVNDQQHAAMMLAKDEGNTKPRRAGVFRAVLVALRHSGARPGSIAAVRVEDVADDFSTWTLRDHKTRKKTGRPLVVYLSPCLQSLTRMLIAGRTEGPLFRDSRGKPWTRNSMRLRMQRLREKLDLPAGTVAYSFRHSFATRALTSGADIATVAELMGHTDATMVARVYGHLAGEKEHLKQAAAKVIRPK